MVSLDIKTAFLIWGAQTATLSILLFSVWAHDRKQMHFFAMAFGFACHGVGMVMIALSHSPLMSWPLYISNLIALGSFCFWIAAFRLLDRRKIGVHLLLPPVVWIGAMLFPGIAESFAFRASVHEVASFLGFALLAYTIVTSQFGTRKYRHILAGLWFTQSLNCLLVAAILLQRQPKDMTFIPYSAFFGVIGVFCLMSVLIVMFKIVMDQNHSLLETLSRTDPLTGTLNRRGLQDAMVKLSQKARKDELLALLVFDLDYFKNINDNFGHQAGDTVLQSFAGMCSSIVMTHGLFARTGGEEFSAVLRVTDLRQAAAIAEQVRHMIATTPIVTDRGVVRLTTSIGISGLAPAAFDYDRLMRDADNALYKAKTEGRNKIGICRNGQIFCITRTEERGTPDAIDTEADRQVAALRRLSHRASPATE